MTGHSTLVNKIYGSSLYDWGFDSWQRQRLILVTDARSVLGYTQPPTSGYQQIFSW
jgi:hypothetical protein